MGSGFRDTGLRDQDLKSKSFGDGHWRFEVHIHELLFPRKCSEAYPKR